MPSYVKKHVRKPQAERREEIVDAALRLLGEVGLEGTTATRIAEAVGLTPGALYRHFDSRDAIVRAANEAASSRAMSWFETATERDVPRRLQQLGDGHFSWATEHLSTIVRPFFQGLSYSQQASLADVMTLPRINMYPALLEIAEEGKRQGTIRDDVRSEDVAWTMMMFAFIQDIAMMLDAEEAITQGVFARNLARMIDSFRPEPSQTGS
jgi:AcrR family transcriptional regulator